METIFLCMFLFGALFTLVTAALGAIGGAGDVGGDVPMLKGDTGPLMLKGADVPMFKGGDGPPVLKGLDAAAHPIMHMFNTSSILAFLTWFGGAGYLFMTHQHWPAVLAAVAAMPIGLAGAALIAFIFAKLKAGSRYRSAEADAPEGKLGMVTVSLPENGVGEIVFSQEGVRRSEAARGLNGQPVPKGTEVLILDYEDGIAIVEPWQRVMAERTVAPPIEAKAQRLQED